MYRLIKLVNEKNSEILLIKQFQKQIIMILKFPRGEAWVSYCMWTTIPGLGGNNYEINKPFGFRKTNHLFRKTNFGKQIICFGEQISKYLYGLLFLPIDYYWRVYPITEWCDRKDNLKYKHEQRARPNQINQAAWRSVTAERWALSIHLSARGHHVEL